jgi:hypothetical protein
MRIRNLGGSVTGDHAAFINASMYLDWRNYRTAPGLDLCIAPLDAPYLIPCGGLVVAHGYAYPIITSRETE